MQRYFMEIAYNGSNYHGWQFQPNASSVQETLENAVSLILREKIKITGCGRTDTGVHASSFYLHFDTDNTKNTEDIKFRLNNYLPHDIAIKNIFPVKNTAHARFNANKRTYKYYIHTEKDPFIEGLSFFTPFKPNLKSMNEACKYLFEFIDFTSFSKVHTDNKTNTCTIYKAEWKQSDHRIIFEISADRFLRNMVRAIVGTMLDIGKGKLTHPEIKDIIKAKDRSAAGHSASAKGLFLTNVEYPKEIFINEN